MSKQTISVRMLKSIGGAALATIFALGLSACAPGTMLAGGGNELNDLRQMTNDGFNRLEADHREMNTAVTNITNTVDDNNQKAMNQIEDLNKRIQEQQKTLERLTADMATLLTRVPSGGTPAPTYQQPSTLPGQGQGPATTPATFVEALQNGKVQLGNKQYDAARESFRAAYGLAANNLNEKLEALYWLGETAYAMRDFPAANQSYGEIQRLKEDSPQAWLSFERQGDIAWEEKKFDEARQRYQAIITTYPQYPRADQVKRKIAELQSGAPAPSPGGSPEVAPAPGAGAPEATTSPAPGIQ